MEDDRFVLFPRTQSGKVIWYYYIYDQNGKRWYRSTGTSNKAKARAYVLKKYKDGTLFEFKAKEILFKEFAEPFWIWETCPIVSSKIKRGGTLTRGYCRSSRILLDQKIIPAFGNKALSAITPDMVDKWLLDIPKKYKVGNKTANKAYMILKQMLDIAVRQRLISHNPCQEVARLIEKDGRRGCFTVEQIGAIFRSEWDNDMALAACKLSATTGMRMGEIRALTPAQVHDDYIEVNAAWGEYDGRKSTKSGETREVPLIPEVRNLLKSLPSYGRANKLIFSLNGTKPIDFQFISLRLHKVLEANGIDWRKEGLSFHSFRHFFNTRLVANGVNGELVRATVGHESSDMTKHYLHLVPSDLNTVMDVARQIVNL